MIFVLLVVSLHIEKSHALGLVTKNIKEPIVVALTRERGKNDKLRKEIQEQVKGSTPKLSLIEVPSVAQVRKTEGEAALDRALNTNWDWIVVTSPEAASVLSDAIERTQTRYDHLSIATVGAATAKALRNIDSKFSPSKATASALASELPSGQSILYPTSALAAPTLQDTLMDRGFRVTRIDAYTTLPATWDDELLQLAKSAHLVAFGSPSAVRVWVERLGNKNTVPVCIGHTTADECSRLGFQQPIAFPENPGVAAWASSIINTASHHCLDYR